MIMTMKNAPIEPKGLLGAQMIFPEETHEAYEWCYLLNYIPLIHWLYQTLESRGQKKGKQLQT